MITISKEKKLKHNWLQPESSLQFFQSEGMNLNRTYYRYMSIDDLKKLLNGSFRFRNPAAWWDPFERLMVEGDYSEIEYSQPATYAVCFTSSSNSEAHWKIYTIDKGACVRVEFDLNNLLGMVFLAEPFESDAIRLYVGEVSYDMPTNSIKSIGKKTSKYHKDMIPSPFKHHDYADLLYLKRRPFIWENEVRVVVLVQNGSSNDSFDIFFKPELAKTFIKSILFEPSNIEKKENEKKWKDFKNSITQMWEKLPHAKYENELSIDRSKLYDSVNSIVFEK